MNVPHPQAAAARMRKLCALRPALAIMLGSGFQRVAEKVEIEAEISYARLPGFQRTGVGGHAGKLVLGRLAGTPVLVLSGRTHYYEGYTMGQVTFRMRAGDFMMLTDHINFMGANPLRGTGANDKSRFVDLTRTYDTQLNGLLKQAARKAGITLRAGVYLAVSGPSYETPAEIRAFARLGADAVGMSTVPEAMVARQCGLRVAAISGITNPAAGRGRQPLSHAEVLVQAEQMSHKAARLLTAFAVSYARSERFSG